MYDQVTHYWANIQNNETWTSKWNPYTLIWRELTKYIMRDAHFLHSMHHGYKGLDFEFFSSFIIFILNKAKFHSHFSISGAEALEAMSWKFSLVQSFYNHLPFNLNRTRSFIYKLEFSLSYKMIGTNLCGIVQQIWSKWKLYLEIPWW